MMTKWLHRGHGIAAKTPLTNFLGSEPPISPIPSAIAIAEYLIIVTQIKTMRAGRIARNFERVNQVNARKGCRRGGRRFGAGRKKGCGKWGEETAVMRVPKSQVEKVKAFLENLKSIEFI